MLKHHKCYELHLFDTCMTISTKYVRISTETFITIPLTLEA